MGRSSTSLAEVRRRLLANPSLIDARGAAVRILARKDKCSLPVAESNLVELNEHVAVDRIFRLVLPEEHARQKGSVVERRFAFFRIMRSLFPVDWDYLDHVWMEGYYDDEDEEPGHIQFFDYGIIIDSMRPFETWQLSTQWDKVPLAYQLADVLFMEQEPADRSNQWDAARKWKLLVSRYGLGGPVKPAAARDRHALLCAFNQARGPLKYLPDAYNVLSFNTGSVFFDYDPEDGIEPYEWSRESVDFLTRQARVARDIEKQIKSLGKWLDAAPARRVGQAFNYYTKYRRILGNVEKQSIRVGAHPRALLDVL